MLWTQLMLTVPPGELNMSAELWETLSLGEEPVGNVQDEKTKKTHNMAGNYIVDEFLCFATST